MGSILVVQYSVSKHLIVRTIGTSEDTQKLYRNLLFFQDGLKFDLQLWFGYVIWKIYNLSTYITEFAGLAGATLTCIVAAILMRIILLIGSYFVYRNFGRGLRKERSQSVVLPPYGSLSGIF
ncbi:hypothetical protein Bpfe_028133 [Biomphalaria pfeifferi]|uniref:Uncharacterized protein n=1 Tax=Biomphalaria pfeifferi TaxID=112525 RepID=A0AAD8AWU8_BIOPF|nr:hypothetical protein Bpfe_028133 [Biomphalaria pfeifferi]